MKTALQPDTLYSQGVSLFHLLSSWNRGAESQPPIKPRSVFLCAALSHLAVACYEALHGQRYRREVGEAAALLALLTKIDDDIIDGLPFHGGMKRDRSQLATQTRAYLAPTLDSIRQGHPQTDEARCYLAAELGARLRQLASSPHRLGQLLHWIERGWHIQVNAVTILTAHPACVSQETVRKAARDISGAWLLMITMVGMLPEDARRPLTAREEHAFFVWGDIIQRADFLSDFNKDITDGHASTYPGWCLWKATPDEYVSALKHRNFARLYTLLTEYNADYACIPDAQTLDSASHGLEELGAVAYLLRWITGFLLWRYLLNPECRRGLYDEHLRGVFVNQEATYEGYVANTLNFLKNVSSECLEH